MNTIAAIATPLLNGAIHIIRISGHDCFDIVQKICQKKIEKKPYSIQRNYIIEKQKIIDDVLLNVFLAPKSYTGEDSIEINCHGGVFIAKKILSLLIINGCELASRGAFSQRAFLNKKINYHQIEGINNLINADNDLAAKCAINSVIGNDSVKIQKLRDKLFDVVGSIEVNIDYPEYDDVPQLTHQQIIVIITQLLESLIVINSNSKRFLPIFDGLYVAIVGKPNAGKSSLLNYLSKEDKAIVSNIQGTTRDIIESSISLNGIKLKLLDTAGINYLSDDHLEKMSIDKSKQAINKADIILWLIASDDNSNQDEIEELLIGKKFLKVYTKADIQKMTNGINISVFNNDIDLLIEALISQIEMTGLDTDNNLILQSDRQIILLEKIINILQKTLVDLNNNVPIDLLQTQFEECILIFNNILGYNFNYDKLDELFSKFCLGK